MSEAPQDAATRRVVLVYFHGHGGSAAEVHSSYREHHDDDVVRLCLDGPYAAGDGGSWFDNGPRGVEWPSLEASLDNAQRIVNAAIADLGATHDALVLGGISQGGAFAIALAAQLDQPILGLLLQNSFVPEGLDGEVDLDAVNATSILIQHGDHDDVVPVYVGDDLARVLKKNATTVEFQTFDCGHTLDPAMVRQSLTWLGEIGGADS